MNLIYILITVQLYGLIFYPTWYAPESSLSVKLIWFHIFYAVILANSYIAVKILKTTCIKARKLNFNFSKNKYFFIMILIFAIGLVPFINFPVLTGLDDHFHAGFPAAFAKEAFNFTNNFTGNSLISTFIFWIIIAASFYLIKIFFSKYQIAPFKIVLCLYPAALFYAFLLSRIGLERFGNIIWFHRYPPLGKTFFGIFYLLFGIQNWSAKLSQILFTLLTSGLLYKLTFRKNQTKKLNLFFCFFFLFNPMIWNIILYTHIEFGTIFFTAITLTFFYKWFQTKNNFFLIIFWIVFSSGLIYKRTILFLFPVFLMFLILVSLKKYKDNFVFFIKTIIVPLIFVLPYFIYDKFYRFSPSSLIFDRILNPFASFLPVLIFPSISGFIISLFGIFGFIYCLKYIESNLLKILYIFTLFYLFLFNISLAWTFTRHIMPIIFSFSIFAGIFFYDLYKKYPKTLIIILIIMFAEMFFLNFFSENIELVTFKTQKYYNAPYDNLIKYIVNNKLYNDKIYAPARTEASHFYIYKYDMPSQNYVRDLWTTENQTLESLFDYLNKNNFKYFIVPQISEERKFRYDYLFLDYFKRFSPENPGYRDANTWRAYSIKKTNTFINDSLHKEIYFNYENYGFKLIKRFNTKKFNLLILKVPDN